MNSNELKAEIFRKGLTIPKLADRMGISKKSLYARMSLQVPFTQEDIMKIALILKLDANDIIRIFFAQKVS